MDRIRHGLETHAPPDERLRVIRAVARADDVLVGRARELVDDDAVAARQPRRGRELDVRLDADSDDRDVASEPSAVARLDGRHARRTMERFDAGAAVNRNAGGAMTILVERRDVGTDRARHDAVGRFEDRDVEAALPRRGRDLEPDVAGADEQHAGAGRQRGRDGVDVADRAQIVHAGQVGAGYGTNARAAPRREQQTVVAQRAPVAQPHPALARLDLLDARVELERDAFFRIEGRRAQQQALARQLPREILLRQRRPLVRRVRLVAKQRDAAREILLA